MTAERGGNFDPFAPVPLPSPSDVARAVAVRTGRQNMDPDRYIGLSGMLQTSYQVSANELHSGTAVIHLLHVGQTDPADTAKKTDRWQLEEPIGHYRPELYLWSLYPEYLPADHAQQQALMRHLEALSHDQDMQHEAQAAFGDQFINLRHPKTQEARHLTSRLARRTGVHDSVIKNSRYVTDEAGVLQTVSVDRFSSSYMVLVPQFDSRSLDTTIATMQLVQNPVLAPIPFVNTLSLVYQGAIFSDGVHTHRGEYVVGMATQLESGSWEPNPKVITDSEWKGIEFITTSLETEKRANPAFMADQCAVGQNLHDSYLLRS